MLAETAVERRQRIESGSERQFIDTQRWRGVIQCREQVLQARLVDVAVEALAQHLVQQIGNLVTAVPALLRHPLQVEFRVEIRLLALEILLQVIGHEAQLARRQAEPADRRALVAGRFAAGLFMHQ
ncbi:hypothetical protein D3C76_1040000 [compost metagenome]